MMNFKHPPKKKPQPAWQSSVQVGVGSASSSAQCQLASQDPAGARGIPASSRLASSPARLSPMAHGGTRGAWPLRAAPAAHACRAWRGMSRGAGAFPVAHRCPASLPPHLVGARGMWERREHMPLPWGGLDKAPTIACTTGWEQKGSFWGHKLTGASSAAFTSHIPSTGWSCATHLCGNCRQSKKHDFSSAWPGDAGRISPVVPVCLHGAACYHPGVSRLQGKQLGFAER